jgi:putative membrane protein
MMWYGSHWVFWQVALMWVGMIAFWGLLIWAVVALVTESSKRSSGPQQSPAGDARRILDERLARGEIDVEEHRRLRDAISPGNQSLVGSAT